MDGTVGICDVSGDWYGCIIGIDHNEGIEGKNTIHIQIPYSEDGTGLAFIDSQYGFQGTSTAFRMNLSKTNSGGWKSSYACTVLVPLFVSTVCEIWRNVISACPKYRDNVGNAQGTASCVTLDLSQVWYLAEHELLGNYGIANPLEYRVQEQYKYYKNGGSIIKKEYSTQSTAVHWWLSSVVYVESSPTISSTDFNIMTKQGYASYTSSAYMSLGVSPCFAVA